MSSDRDDDDIGPGRFAWAWLDDAEENAQPECEAAKPAPIDYEALLEQQIAEVEERDRQRARLQRMRALVAPVARRRSRPLDIGDQLGSSPPLAVRLPRWLEEQIRRELERQGVTPSTGLRQILEEWWVLRRYPALEFRGEEFLRLASIRGGAAVADWVAAEPRPELPEDVREQALDYVELFRSRIEAELRK